jgi:F-type H+-transporting ATPase subunit epsilon
MFDLSVVTPDKIIFEDQVLSITVPGAAGYLGILSNHAPVITSLQPGLLTVTEKNGNTLFYAVSGGFMEVSFNQATLLADAVEPAGEIDLTRAENARRRAIEMIQGNIPGLDLLRAKYALTRAENRIRISGRSEGKKAG